MPLPLVCNGHVASILFDAFMHPLEALGLRRCRRTLVPRAVGRVLEVGSGTGVNFAYLNWNRIERLALVDLAISPGVRRYPFPERVRVEFHETSVEALPFGDGAFDSALFTLVFCTVADNRRGLSELFRVVAPGGKIYFIEHVLPRTELLRVPMRTINPLWHRFSGGCNLTRETAAAIRSAGFRIEKLEQHARGILIAGVAVRPI